MREPMPSRCIHVLSSKGAKATESRCKPTMSSSLLDIGDARQGPLVSDEVA